MSLKSNRVLSVVRRSVQHNESEQNKERITERKRDQESENKIDCSKLFV